MELTIAIIAIEGQSEVDYRMVFRNMFLEALNYNHQWKLSELINVKENKEYLVIDEIGKEKVDMCKAFEDFKEEGREETLQVTIELCKSLGGSIQIITEKIARTFSISEDDARKKVEMYW